LSEAKRGGKEARLKAGIFLAPKAWSVGEGTLGDVNLGSLAKKGAGFQAPEKMRKDGLKMAFAS
jgi:hypothetical protein